MAATVSLLTVVTIVGAVLVMLLVVPGFVGSLLPRADRIPLAVQFAVGVPVFVLPVFVASGLWGLGVGLLAGVHPWRAARAGALAVTGMVALLEVPVHMSQALPAAISRAFPLGFHGVFTAVFMIEVALVAGVAAARVAYRVEAGHVRRTGWTVAASAAVGFLAGSLLAMALGYRVGSGSGMRMVWALFVSSGVSAASAGCVLGWRLTPFRRTASAGVRTPLGEA